jgi:hypothetical protein
VASCTASFISPIVLRLGFYSGDAQAISAGMLVPILTSRLKLMLFLDDDYACPKTIHAGLCLYSPIPETDEADVVSDGALIPVPFVHT